jgi:hypothetical protein
MLPVTGPADADSKALGIILADADAIEEFISLPSPTRSTARPTPR